MDLNNAGAERTEVEHAIRDAMEHALSCGDEVTAGELESILDFMAQARGAPVKRWLH